MEMDRQVRRYTGSKFYISSGETDLQMDEKIWKIRFDAKPDKHSLSVSPVSFVRRRFYIEHCQ